MSVVVTDLTYTYSRKTAYEKTALRGVNLRIETGEFVGIIGHTGSGKSTFIQHLNGLILPQSGSVQVLDIALTQKKCPKADLRRLRGSVGMVFQYPEYQLFAETVEKDVAFGPKNMGLSDDEVRSRTEEAIRLVGLDYDAIRAKAPFDLSGGQKRRVAIAGILAMRPQILVLDEPSAGLDPAGKEQILSLICKLKRECSPTVIVISHDIDEIVRVADRLVVFDRGGILYDEPMGSLFTHAAELRAAGLDIPRAVRIADALRERGVALEGDILHDGDLFAAILRRYQNAHGLPIDAEQAVERARALGIGRIAELAEDGV